MTDNKMVAALVMRLPEQVSWSLGNDDQSREGKDWRGLITELAANEKTPATVSLTFLLELDGAEQSETQ